MAGTAAVALAATAFVGSHFALSHPWRRPLVAAMGEGAFTGVYSVVAAGLLGSIAWAYQTAPTTAPLWPVGDTLWAIATALMLAAAILLAGSLVGNPARPGPPAPIPPEARGVFAVTRHPMLWSFAIWGVCHVLVYPVAKNIVVAVAMTILALVGARLQDRKRAARDPPAGRPGRRGRASSRSARSRRGAPGSAGSGSPRWAAARCSGWRRPGRTSRSRGGRPGSGAGLRPEPQIGRAGGLPPGGRTPMSWGSQTSGEPRSETR